MNLLQISTFMHYIVNSCTDLPGPNRRSQQHYTFNADLLNTQKGLKQRDDHQKVERIFLVVPICNEIISTNQR